MLTIFTVSPMSPVKPITQPVPACTSGIILILHLLKTSIDVSEYEEEYYPVKQPSLVDMLKLRMYELELTQKFSASMSEKWKFWQVFIFPELVWTDRTASGTVFALPIADNVDVHREQSRRC